MTYIEIDTMCTHPLIGVCSVKGYDDDDRAIVQYAANRYKSHTCTAHIPTHMLKIVNR